MKKFAINFDDSIYDDCISGMALKAQCNKSYKACTALPYCDTVVEHGDIWFMHRDYMPEFFRLLPNNCPPISVVTQHSDNEVDDAVMRLKPPCVRRVFGSNTTSELECATPIPLGLGPPYCPITPKAEHIKSLTTRRDRSRLLYVNFRVSTFPTERVIALNSMRKFAEICPGVTIESAPPDPSIMGGYLNAMVDHVFCLCPRGNGIDTHRLWESLYCRTIPIVKYNRAHRNITDLPILFVDDWNQITEEFLLHNYERIISCEWNFSKLRASWWGQQFKG